MHVYSELISEMLVDERAFCTASASQTSPTDNLPFSVLVLPTTIQKLHFLIALLNMADYELDQEDTNAVTMDLDKPVAKATQQKNMVDDAVGVASANDPADSKLKSPLAKKPKKDQKDKGPLECRVPHARVKRIMKSDKEVKLISNDAATLVCKATVNLIKNILVVFI